MTKKIGIIGAMDDEISVYLKSLEEMQEVKYKIFTFYLGKMQGKEVVIVKSGVGKVFASMICQYLIDEFDVGTVLFTGVAGSLNKTLEIGDVVVSIDSVHHDFNASQLGFPRGNISYTDYRFFKADENLRNKALEINMDGHKIIAGRILTGDQFMTQKEKTENDYLTNELAGDCIEMEGAAVAQVCTINEIPHLIIRTVSDKADGTAVDDYNKFTPIIAKNSFKIVEGILERI